MTDSEQLPSLPALTLKIREAVRDPDTDYKDLCRLIRMDPSLCAMLMKYANSPMNRTANQPSSIEGIVALLGTKVVYNIVMLHSVKSLFVMQSPRLKALFALAWQRMLHKSAYSALIAVKLRYRQADQVPLASFLCELGTLAVLSALKDEPKVPDERSYFGLCREYSKSLSLVLIKKWNLGLDYDPVVRSSGQWDKDTGPTLALSDLVNLGLYHGIANLTAHPNLPPLESLVAYEKIPGTYKAIDQSGQLVVVSNNRGDLATILAALQ